MHKNNGKGGGHVSISRLARDIKEAQKDPDFIREVNKFIKIISGVYKLKDYNLENLK